MVKVRLNDKNIRAPIRESGKTLEHYFSEKSEIIKQLKKTNKKNEILIDSSYWIGENFEKLEEIVSKNKFENEDGNDEDLDEIEEEDNFLMIAILKYLLDDKPKKRSLNYFIQIY